LSTGSAGPTTVIVVPPSDDSTSTSTTSLGAVVEDDGGAPEPAHEVVPTAIAAHSAAPIATWIPTVLKARIEINPPRSHASASRHLVVSD
jgi:hypothetical protein